MASKLETALVERCSMTKTQVAALKLHSRVRKGEISARAAAASRNRSGTTIGAYYRVVGQARANVVRALFTLVLCSKFNVIGVQDLIKLAEVAQKIPSELDGEAYDQVISLLDGLVRRVVMI